MHVARLLMKDSFKHSSFASLPRLSDLQHYFVEQVLAKDTLRRLSRQKKAYRLTHYYQPTLPGGVAGTHTEYDLPAREVSASRLLGKLEPNKVESGPQRRNGSYPVLCLAASRAEIPAWMAFAVSRRRCNLRALRLERRYRVKAGNKFRLSSAKRDEGVPGRAPTNRRTVQENNPTCVRPVTFRGVAGVAVRD